VRRDVLLPGAPIRMLVSFSTFGNGAHVPSNYKFILASPPASSAAHDPTLLMIVIYAGMNGLLPYHSPVGETWTVAGISACELFNGFQMDPSYKTLGWENPRRVNCKSM
jgi:hypothetical protein